MHEDDLAAAEEAHFVSLTAAEADGDERTIEAALRPRSLDEVVGQVRVRVQEVLAHRVEVGVLQ